MSLDRRPKTEFVRDPTEVVGFSCLGLGSSIFGFATKISTAKPRGRGLVGCNYALIGQLSNDYLPHVPTILGRCWVQFEADSVIRLRCGFSKTTKKENLF